MPIQVQCECGKSYSLKDEFAGKLVQCPDCGRTVRVGSSPVQPQADPVFDRDKFLLRQQHMSISEKYYVCDEQNAPILFVERSHKMAQFAAVLAAIGVVVAGIVIIASIASSFNSDAATAISLILGIPATIAAALLVAVKLMPKRHVTFYRDDSKAESLLRVLQDKKFQFLNATYTVVDPQGQLLCRFHKNYLYNLFRKRWYCYAPDGSVMCMAKEDSIILSLLRRSLGPMFGFLRTNFIIVRTPGDDVIGEFNRKFTILDRYALDMTADPMRTLDRRVALALGVMLDTGEQR